ncbi:MAG TPA: DUF1993 domain-containing protein [Casimicrobiaceae bacterium]|nr:DUF1993 domain-containing protein [Casimicrobiaceae bacterium]
MPYPVQQIAVTVLGRALENLKSILAKGKAHAEERKIAESVFLSARLYPDMFPLTRQVHIATDTARGAAARLAGVEPPTFDPDEQDFDDLIDRVDKTLAYMRSLDPKAFDGAETREIARPVGGKPHTFTGTNYLLQYSLPNVFFHVTTAYDILRHNGVPLGKADYLGVLD